MKNKIKIILAIIVVSITISSCTSKDLEQTLTQEAAVEGTIETFEDLDLVVSATYSWMTQSNYYSRNAIMAGEIRSDNAYSTSFTRLSEFNLTERSTTPAGVWSGIYSTIGAANLAISTTVSGDVKKIKHTKGAAYALRALAYFDLLRFYGQHFVAGEGDMNSLGVPYITDFQSKVYANSRNTVAECKVLIEEDLAMAITLMSIDLDNPSKQYMTTNGVKALQARIALYFKEFEKARDYAKQVIDSNLFSVIPATKYIASWKTESTENSIFELAYDSEDNSGTSSIAYAYRDFTDADGDILSNGHIFVYEAVLDLFTPGDIRIDTLMINKDHEGDLRNFGKYPSNDYSDNINVIRYEEVILIYAEALLETGGDALQWLNMIPAERNSAPYAVANKENILLERRKELLFEGFRFDDLARTGQNISVLNNDNPSLEPILFGDFRYAFPIPENELGLNTSMVQNKDY
ncbi:MAG: RagB/SusD family nutrient uptake outer membrane protein [Cellulophaga sp.]